MALNSKQLNGKQRRVLSARRCISRLFESRRRRSTPWPLFSSVSTTTLSDSALFIDSQPTDLRRLIDIVLDGLPPHVRDQRVGVAGEQVICVADPLRLRQVLRSMLNNALAYTPSRIEVAVMAQQQYARVRIYDEQVTEKANLNPLTALTHMTNRAAATVSPPLGVGLAVSRDLVRRMGGDLLYEVNGTISYELRLPLHAK